MQVDDEAAGSSAVHMLLPDSPESDGEGGSKPPTAEGVFECGAVGVKSRRVVPGGMTQDARSKLGIRQLFQLAFDCGQEAICREIRVERRIKPGQRKDEEPAVELLDCGIQE